VWAVWAIVFLVVAAVIALAATGVWIFAVLLALVAIGIGLGLRFAGTLGETGRMRRFRGQARGAGPDADPDVEFTDRDRETLAS
jgi:hypothetical protein